MLIIRDVQGRIDKFLLHSDSLQNNLDYRFKILFYTLGEVIRHDVYELFYSSKSPLKSSFKIFCADAVIQILIYLRLKGANLEEVINMGLNKVTQDREYEQKIFKRGA